MWIIVFMVVYTSVLSRTSSVSLSGHIRLRRSGTGEQQMVRRDLVKHRRESCGNPVRRRIGSSFRIDGSKFCMVALAFDIFFYYIVFRTNKNMGN